MTQRLTMYQVSALGAVRKAAAATGECLRPKGVQNATMRALLGFGLVALREVKRGQARRARGYVATNMWRLTDAGRAVLGSPDPASAALPAATAGAGTEVRA